MELISRARELRTLAGSLACAAIYVTARGIQLLQQALDVGVGGGFGWEMAFMLFTAVGLLMPWRYVAPIAVGTGLLSATFGIIEFDLPGVGCLILLVGFRLELPLLVAAAAGLSYLGLTTLSITDNSPFADVVLLCVAGIMMSLVRTKLSTAELHQTAELAERRAELEAARSWLAGEIHDSVGHYLSAIQALANGAKGNPDLADEALNRISGLANSALADSRRLIELAHQSTSREGRLTLSDLDRSLSEMKLFGVRTSINIVGSASSPLVEDGVVRVVREAVTNAARHAKNMSLLEASVRFHDAGADVLVCNDGLPVAEPGYRSGLATLSRMLLERGGTVTSGPCIEGGWRVVARVA